MEIRKPPSPEPLASSPGRPVPGAWWVRGAWIYLLGLVGAWALLALVGERWWPVTLFLFSPRWVVGLPLVVFLLATAWAPKRLAVPLLLALLVFLGPILGGCIPWNAAGDGENQSFRLRIVTCNIDGSHLDAAALRGFLDEVRPDVVALQEWQSRDEGELFGEPGWHVRPGRGLYLASRFPIRAAEALPDEHDWRDLVCRCELETSGGRVAVCNLHLPTPRWGFEALRERGVEGIPEMSANTVDRRRESGRAVQFISESTAPLLIAGDFNTPADSDVYRDDWGRFANAFSSAGLGWGYTKHTRWHGVRIDHVLAGPGWRFSRCRVGPNVGADHRPVLAEVLWVGTSD